MYECNSNTIQHICWDFLKGGVNNTPFDRIYSLLFSNKFVSRFQDYTKHDAFRIKIGYQIPCKIIEASSYVIKFLHIFI